MSPVSVSVVTPCFNTAPFLRATIESIQMQGHPHLQHIVMDGGSTDGTVDILKEYPHIEWLSEKDRGQSHALNKGFRRVQGEIIGWLNADDTYEPGAIQTAVAYLEHHADADAVFSDVNIIDESGTLIGLSKGAPFDTVELLMSNMVKQPSLFMRRCVLDALGGVDERYHFVMDQELWLRMGMAGFRMDYLPGPPLANFRICDGTKTYESAPRFHAEWLQIVLRAIDQPVYRTLTDRQRRNAVGTVTANLHLSRMLEAIEARDRVTMLRRLVDTIRSSNGLVLNAGLWRLVAGGMFGRRPGKLRKYRRSA